MATSDPKEHVPIFKCPVCLEKRKRPRNLPCLHSLCKICIQSLLQSSSVEKENGYKAFECPVCRTEIISPEPDMSVEIWSSKFPLNHLILSVEDDEDEKFDIKCDPCNRVEEENLAKYRCHNCRENICELCYSCHRRFQDLSTHKLSDLSELSSSESLEIGQSCPIHERRDCEVYCFDHESLCCSLCSVTQHRQCQTVKTLDEIVDGDEDSATLNDLLSFIDRMSSETMAVKETTKESKKRLDEKQTIISDTVSGHIDEVKDKLDQLHDQFQKKVNQTHFDEKQTLELVDGKLSGLLTTLENCKQEATVVASRGSKKQKYLTMQNIKKQISTHMKMIEKLKERKGNPDYEFEKDEGFYESTQGILKANMIGDFTAKASESSILIDIHEIFYDDVFKCSSNDFIETTFRYTFENVSTFPLFVYQKSPIFRVRNVPWGIECKPIKVNDKKYLEVYLRCMLDVGNLKWSCNAEVEIRIINQIVKKENFVRKFKDVRVFTNKDYRRGYSKFIEWDKVVDCANGFIKDDRITLEVQIKADVPTRLS